MNLPLYLNPLELNRILFGEKQKWTLSQYFTGIGILLIQAGIIVVTAQYWWWGSMYLRTGLLFWAALSFTLIVPCPFISRRFGAMCAWHAWILLLPTLICSILMILFRLGVTDIIVHRYFYRSYILLAVACFSLLWALFWKIYAYRLVIQGSVGKRVIFISVACLWDCIWAFGFLMLLLNIETIIPWILAIM